jgi:predicted small secreted protein
MKLLAALFFVVMSLLLAACGTTDGALKDQGQSESYIQGFHDGRHSGMKEEGNNFEHYIKDEARFSSDREYESGWLAGELEGKALQDQAVAVGNAAAGAYSSSEIDKEVSKSTDYDKAARDAVKGVDTTGMEDLGK